MCDYGEITIELFEPRDPESSFYQDLQAIGRPFIHHVIMRTKPHFYEVAEEKGVEEHMSAYFPRIDERGRWFATSDDLGFDVYAWDPHVDGPRKSIPTITSSRARMTPTNREGGAKMAKTVLYNGKIYVERAAMPRRFSRRTVSSAWWAAMKKSWHRRQVRRRSTAGGRR